MKNVKESINLSSNLYTLVSWCKFHVSGHRIFMTLLQVILVFYLVKDETQEFVEQIYAAPFQGWM